MSKKIMKMLLISIVFFLGALFINVDGVKAESCVCSFKGLGPEEKTMVGGNNPRTVVSRTVYLAEFNVYDSEHEYSGSDITYFGEAKVNDYVDDNFKSTTEIKAKLQENTSGAKFLSGYNKGNFHDVVANQCSVSACASINATFHSCAYSKELALNTSASQLGCWNVDLEAIDSEQAANEKQTEYGNDILPSVTGYNVMLLVMN